MKNLVVIFRANLQQDVADLLRGLAQVSGFTFSHVEGHGAAAAADPFLSARDKVVGYVPRVRLDVILREGDLAAVTAAIREKSAGVGGYWVTPVEDYGRL